MPPRSKEEKERRRLLHKQKLEARKITKEEKKKEEEAAGGTAPKKDSRQYEKADAASIDLSKLQPGEANASSPLVSLPEDALLQVFCYLPSRELGATTMTCRALNYAMTEGRVPHLLSRLDIRGRRGHGPSVSMCENEAEARELLEKSFGVGETGRLITKKSRKDSCGADEYIAYARFLEDGVSGYSTQGFGGKTTPLLPPVVNGRFASASPEHSLCRRGGGGDRSGAGGSGVSSWGVGKRGQLGHGKREDEGKPRMLLGGIGYGIRIVQVSAGGGLVRVAHSLLLTSTGRVLSFGTAMYGQLGHGYSAGKQLSDVLRPQYIEALSGVRCICVSAGELHSAAVTTDGDVYTWGDGFCGQLGLGDKRPQLLPCHVTQGGLEDEVVASVSCGCRHTLCVTEDGEVFSFGLGHFGVLGRAYTPFETNADAAIVGLVDDMPPPVAMVPANNEAMVVPTETGVDAGQNAEAGGVTDEVRAHLDLLASLTLDDSSDQCIPMLIDSLDGVHIVGASAGHRHSMVLDDKGELYTFGSGVAGALGHGDFIKQEYPMKVKEFANNGISILQMSAGVDISMAVTTTGEVYAWGKTDGGRIGLGMSNMNVPVPRRVIMPGDGHVKCLDVDCGYVHSIVIGLDGTVYVCGNVGIDGEEDGQRDEFDAGDIKAVGRPVQLKDFNIWHRIPEPKVAKSTERWKKYGKYELKGRRAMMEESERWN